MSNLWKNKLFFGDNLRILREHIDSESVDLVYGWHRIEAFKQAEWRQNAQAEQAGLL